MSYKEYDRVLCQDCLKLDSFTEQKHEGRVFCSCGGEFCGCASCMLTANALVSKDFKTAKIHGLLITEEVFNTWSESDGIRQHN
ncbi:hypothetical protein NVP1250O_13 [Vibrio phage 1.250.O._10N.261.55.E11]|nr:hypothetical protein NVP1250O_13 [Vibrio phage 1.250.O._10N.261.55.E11]